MALPALALDDARFDQLVIALRRRIPATSNGRWTLHEPVDPGITLLELFSWQLEQRSYWLDRVSDPMLRAIVELLGERMEPVRSAATVVGFAPQPWLALPAGVARLDIRGVGPKLTIAEPMVLAPIERVGLVTRGRDRSDDLDAGRAVKLFEADGKPGEARIVLWLASPPPGGTDPLSILIELLSPADLVPRWSPLLAGPVAPPAKLEVVYRDATNRIVPIGADDGTDGLRRSGLVRFVPPANWQPEGPPQGGLTPYAVIVRTEHATFTYPPRVTRIVPNAAAATHRRAAHHALHASWLPLPGNAIALPEAESLPIAETIEVSIDEVVAGWQTWRATPSLAFHGPGDRVFEVDRDAGRLRFGDGLTGRIPRPQETTIPNVSIDYAVGGGERGNLGAGLAWVHEPTGLGVANVVDVSGGAEPESPRAAADRVASALKRPTRAIVAADYEELALTTPGLAIRRAHAAVGYSSLSPCIAVPGMVTVFVVPFAPREDANELVEDAFVATPQPDPGALHEMRARLDDARLVTHEVCVRGPLYREARIRIEIVADTGEPAELRRLVASRVARYLDPLVGGDDGAGWPFGEPLRQSAILRVAQAAIRGEGTVVRVAVGVDPCVPDETCHEVQIGDHALVGPATIEVHVRHQPPAKGALR